MLCALSPHLNAKGVPGNTRVWVVLMCCSARRDVATLNHIPQVMLTTTIMTTTMARTDASFRHRVRCGLVTLVGDAHLLASHPHRALPVSDYDSLYDRILYSRWSRSMHYTLYTTHNVYTCTQYSVHCTLPTTLHHHDCMLVFRSIATWTGLGYGRKIAVIA